MDGNRLDPHFFQPEFATLVRAIRGSTHDQLGKVVQLSTEQWSPDDPAGGTFRYLEISGVDPKAGEATAVETAVAEAPSRARMLIREGDIIVSLTRPHHGAIAQVKADLDGCVASTGFAVIRRVDESRISRDFLWVVLRSRLVLPQLLQRSSGGNYPAITEAELLKVIIPVPSPKVQQVIAEEARRRRNEARRLRDEAATLWATAKCRFEERLLGPTSTSAKL